jgi:hypothetical protein
MNSVALEVRRRFRNGDLERSFVKNPATGPGRAQFTVHSTSAADAVSHPDSHLFVGSVGFSNLTVPQVSGVGASIGGSVAYSNLIVGPISAGISSTAVFDLSTVPQVSGRGLASVSVGGYGVSSNLIVGPISAGINSTSVFDLSTAPTVRLVGFGNPTMQQAGIGANASNETISTAYGLEVGEPPSNLSRCLHVLHSRRRSLNDAQADALARQLRALLSEEDELREVNLDVSEPSLYELIDFLSEHKTFAHPSLSITRIGHFAASWSPRKRAKLTIVFNPGGNGEWIAIDLDATHPLHDKGSLANLFDKFAMWMRA